LTCAPRLDGVWRTVAQKGHLSGFKGLLPPPSPPPSPPISEPACSLNGNMTSSGSCSCDPGWRGKTCGQLDLLPAPPLATQVSAQAALASDNGEANATWGMSVVGPIGETYHGRVSRSKSVPYLPLTRASPPTLTLTCTLALALGYMTEIANSCGLGQYGSASQVVHMTSLSPLGPWIRRGVALAGFAHNPQAILTPNGTLLLFHIGTEEKPGCLLDCNGTKPSGSNPHPPKPRPAGCATSLSHAASVAVASGPFGPFKRLSYIFGTDHSTNPAPFLDADGTLVVALRR
jgi:hypothetical protein